MVGWEDRGVGDLACYPALDVVYVGWCWNADRFAVLAGPGVTHGAVGVLGFVNRSGVFADLRSGVHGRARSCVANWLANVAVLLLNDLEHAI